MGFHLEIFMKKILSRLLLIFNICLVAFLLLFSLLFLWISAAKPAAIFGLRPVLVTGSSGGTLCMTRSSSREYQVGDKLLLQDSEGCAEAEVTGISDQTLTCRLTADGNSVETSVGSSAILGKVVSESHFWGNLFFLFSTPEYRGTAYVCIVIAFLFAGLALFLTHILTTKLMVPLEEESAESPLSPLAQTLLIDEVKEANERDESEEAPEESLPAEESAPLSVEFHKHADVPPAPTAPSAPPSASDEEPPIPLLQLSRVLRRQQQGAPSAPPPRPEPVHQKADPLEQEYQEELDSMTKVFSLSLDKKALASALPKSRPAAPKPRPAENHSAAPSPAVSNDELSDLLKDIEKEFEELKDESK